MEKRKAFTLIELMGVLVIIGILILILVPVINNAVKNNKEELYNKQLDLIKLLAKNLASDKEYILPEEDGDEIYLTLGQLRAMGYAEEIITNPKTKENFPDNLVVMIIKVGKDYDYDIILDGGEVLTTSGIIVFNPSKRYIKKGSTSSYIITAKTKTQVGLETTEYYVDIEKSNIVLRGVGETDPSIKYKLDGNKGLYKLTVAGGNNEGNLYFNFKDLKDIKGKEIDTTTINSNINNVSNNKQIIVDNTAPVINFTTNGTTVWAKSVGTKITVTDNSGSNSLDSSTYKYIYSLSSSQTQTLKNSYNLTDIISQTSGDGEYYLIAQACDKAGNCATKTSNKFLVDNTAPTCSWSGENSTWTTSAQAIKLTGIDNHKMNNLKTSYTKTYNQSGIEISKDNLSYEIEDEAGNKTTCNKAVNVYYDTKKPEITKVENPTNGEWVNYAFKVTLITTENGSGIAKEQNSYQSNAGWVTDNATISGNTVTTSNFASERNQLAYIRVCDKVGNCSEQRSTWIRIDTTKPSVSASVGSCSNGKRTISISASDSASGIYGYAITTSLSEPSSFSSSASGSYAPGTYYAWAKDNAGNTNSTTVSVGNCITAADICKAKDVDLFGKSKGSISGNFGSYYTNLNSNGSWGNWCRANGTLCSPTSGYDVKCAGSLCDTYGIKGLTVTQINTKYGCDFGRFWCSCNGSF